MQTNEIVRDLIEKINACEGAGEKFLAVYAHEYKPEKLPIDKIYIAFETSQNTIGFFEDDSKECCKRTKVTVKSDFISPPNKEISACYCLAEDLMDILTMQYAGKLSSYTIGKAAADNDLKAFRIPCLVELVYEQCPAYNDEGTAIKPFADFFCKTHVNDSVIHLTSDEKEYINAPFVTGMYGGNGEERQEFELGFRPKFVLVFGSGSSGIGITDGVYTAYFGFALRNRATKGIEITQNGFAVMVGSLVISKNVYTNLNSYAQTYNYIAFK